MEISVIIPSYKPDKYIFECLDSVINQTLESTRYEVIVILNGCHEPYKKKLQDYAFNNRINNIVILQTDVAGVSNARNIGLDNSKGEYIAFIDDDDVISNNYLEELLSVSSQSCVGCSNSYCFIENIEDRHDNFITKGYKKCMGLKYSILSYRCFLSTPWAKLIHKSIIAENRFPIDLRKSEDSVFCMCISPNICDIKLAVADTIYYQRVRAGSAMRTKQSVSQILKEHLYIEWKYITEWCKHPFKYNFIFVLSRIVACLKNCMGYLMYQAR